MLKVIITKNRPESQSDWVFANAAAAPPIQRGGQAGGGNYPEGYIVYQGSVGRGGGVNSNPGWSVLVVAGNGHVIYNAAIPASVKSRAKNIRQASFYTENADKCPAVFPKANKGMANYMWYINHSTTAVIGKQ